MSSFERKIESILKAHEDRIFILESENEKCIAQLEKENAEIVEVSRPTHRSNPLSNLLRHIAIPDTLSNILRLTVIGNTPQTCLRYLLSRRYLSDVSLTHLVASLSF
jgi:hypothetical protein